MSTACASGLFTLANIPALRAAPAPAPSTSFTIEPRGPFSLEAARVFLEGFTPGTGSADTRAGQLTIAFRADRTFAPCIAQMKQDRDGIVRVAVTGTADRESASRQVARILSLDVDATAWPAIGERDGVVGALQKRFAGSRPVVFPSPYEAAAWGVLGQRVSMAVAATWKRALATEHGDRVRVGDEIFTVFPGPEKLRAVQQCGHIPHEKLVRLHAVADAAMSGALDADRLRAMSETDALAVLQKIRGVGAWTAAHILMRGCGLADADPVAEPRVLRGFAAAYGLDHTPTALEYARAAQRWRPFGMWVAVLLVRSIADTPAWRGRERRG